MVFTTEGIYIYIYILYFEIIIFLDYYIDIFSDYYCHSLDVLNVISEVFKNLRNEQIILFYKSSSFKVVLCHSEGSEYTQICFGIVAKVKKSN